MKTLLVVVIVGAVIALGVYLYTRPGKTKPSKDVYDPNDFKSDPEHRHNEKPV